MDYLQAFAISAAGMTAERTRVEAAVVNIANAHVAQHPAERSAGPMRAVVRAAPFATLVDQTGGVSTPVATLEPAPGRARLVHEPGHPMADERGFVAYPGVDPVTEMVTLMSAMRSYEANVAALNTARVLALKTLEIGRNA
ncbi:MAG TPA: flagellar basal body rod protein FlgC [Ramlibacter sp.]|uniref:flagellar basal body rod protein FlgC n=1 Tax=Ramlibacter sp. TaxID=1917967 RepID=UPI002ED62CE8